MGLVTLFLLTIISILLLGHALLFLTKQEGLLDSDTTFLEPVRIEQPVKQNPLRVTITDPIEPDSKLLDELKILKTKMGIVDEKATMAHSRISDLEDAYIDIENNVSKEQEPKKLLDFNEFKANIETELSIIRRILEDVDLHKNHKHLLEELSVNGKAEHETIDDLVFSLKKKNDVLNGKNSS